MSELGLYELQWDNPNNSFWILIPNLIIRPGLTDFYSNNLYCYFKIIRYYIGYYLFLFLIDSITLNLFFR